MKTMLLCQSCGGVVGGSAAEIEPDLLIDQQFDRLDVLPKAVARRFQPVSAWCEQ